MLDNGSVRVPVCEHLGMRWEVARLVDNDLDGERWSSEHAYAVLTHEQRTPISLTNRQESDSAADGLTPGGRHPKTRPATKPWLPFAITSRIRVPGRSPTYDHAVRLQQGDGNP